MSETRFSGIYMNMKNGFFVCYARQPQAEVCYEEDSHPYNKVNAVFPIRTYADWEVMQSHFASTKKNSGAPLLETACSYPTKHVGNIDIVVKDSKMSLVFGSEMGGSSVTCSGQNEEEFTRSFSALVKIINKH